MNINSNTNYHNLIIQPHPVDTLSNIAHITAFFKEFYEVNNPDFAMSDESRMGFYVLLNMVQQAADFETLRLSGELGVDATPFSHETMPKEARDELEKIMNKILGYKEDEQE